MDVRVPVGSFDVIHPHPCRAWLQEPLTIRVVILFGALVHGQKCTSGGAAIGMDVRALVGGSDVLNWRSWGRGRSCVRGRRKGCTLWNRHPNDGIQRGKAALLLCCGVWESDFEATRIYLRIVFPRRARRIGQEEFNLSDDQLPSLVCIDPSLHVLPHTRHHYRLVLLQLVCVALVKRTATLRQLELPVAIRDVTARQRDFVGPQCSREIAIGSLKSLCNRCISVPPCYVPVDILALREENINLRLRWSRRERFTSGGFLDRGDVRLKLTKFRLVDFGLRLHVRLIVVQGALKPQSLLVKRLEVTVWRRQPDKNV